MPYNIVCQHGLWNLKLFLRNAVRSRGITGDLVPLLPDICCFLLLHNKRRTRVSAPVRLLYILSGYRIAPAGRLYDGFANFSFSAVQLSRFLRQDRLNFYPYRRKSRFSTADLLFSHFLPYSAPFFYGRIS